MRVCKELFNWMNTVANQNEKYADKMKITNYGYFLMVIPPMQVIWLQFFRMVVLCFYLFLLVVSTFPRDVCVFSCVTSFFVHTTFLNVTSYFLCLIFRWKFSRAL